MKTFNQVVEKSQLIPVVEEVKFNRILAEKADEKLKKIPDELSLSISLLIAQLPPESRELIKTYISLSEKQNLVLENKVSGGNSADILLDCDAASLSKFTALKSFKDKASPDLDAMMLAVIGPKAIVSESKPIESARMEKDSRVTLTSDKHKKTSSDANDDTQGQSDIKNTAQKHQSGQDAVRIAQSDNALAQAPVPPAGQPVPNLQGQSFTASANPTQDQQTVMNLNLLQKNSQQPQQGHAEDTPMHNNRAIAGDAGYEDYSVSKNGAGPDNLNHRSKSEVEETADAAQPLQTVFAPTTLQDAAFSQFSKQAQNPSSFQRSAAQEKAHLAALNATGSVEGIKFNLNSLGQDKSVQITGSNKSGYTLRPSDEQVQNILRKHKDESLSVSIENAPGVTSADDDIAQLRIEALSGRDSATA